MLKSLVMCTPVSPLQQCSKHAGRQSPEPARGRDTDDPGHQGNGPGSLPVHGQKRSWGGQDITGHPAVLWSSL